MTPKSYASIKDDAFTPIFAAMLHLANTDRDAAMTKATATLLGVDYDAPADWSCVALFQVGLIAENSGDRDLAFALHRQSSILAAAIGQVGRSVRRIPTCYDMCHNEFTDGPLVKMPPANRNRPI